MKTLWNRWFGPRLETNGWADGARFTPPPGAYAVEVHVNAPGGGGGGGGGHRSAGPGEPGQLGGRPTWTFRYFLPHEKIVTYTITRKVESATSS